MLSDSLRFRLRQLSRKRRLPTVAPTASRKGGRSTVGGSIPGRMGSSSIPPGNATPGDAADRQEAIAARTMPLESAHPWRDSVELPPGGPVGHLRYEEGSVVTNAWGAHWEISIPLSAFVPGWDIVALAPLTEAQLTALPPASRSVYPIFREKFPMGCLFLDLETCGLAGSAIFLAGVVHGSGGQWRLTQLWARDYAEEASVLWALTHLVQRHACLVTFNGKSFDWPQVRDRHTLYQAAAPRELPELPHLDLLHICRRRYKHVLPNCKLQTLESAVCGRSRQGDVPGREIPDIYHAYVRDGSRPSSVVQGILHHNALDLVTLVELSLIVGGRP